MDLFMPYRYNHTVGFLFSHWNHTCFIFIVIYFRNTYKTIVRTGVEHCRRRSQCGVTLLLLNGHTIQGSCYAEKRVAQLQSGLLNICMYSRLHLHLHAYRKYSSVMYVTSQISKSLPVSVARYSDNLRTDSVIVIKNRNTQPCR